MVHLVKAEAADLNIIHTLANHIWNAHYVPIIGKNQVDYMLGTMYSHQRLLQQFHEKEQVFYLIYHEHEAIGFLTISTKHHSEAFIHKLYIHQNQSNQGIGTTVLQQLVHLLNPKRLTLRVNRKNYKAINFYFKNGFKIGAVEDIDIGNGYFMNDFVMVKAL